MIANESDAEKSVEGGRTQSDSTSLSTDSNGKSVEEKRSEHEDFSLHVCQGGVGYINVVNRSYNDDKSHTYSVEVNDGHAVGCSCPHATYRDAHCKHQRVVEQSPLVLSASNTTAKTTVLTDGGQEDGSEDDGDETDGPITEAQYRESRDKTETTGVVALE